MELTTEQALQQAVSAHNKGEFQLAERIYRAILQTQPDHPDANHNLGVLLVSLEKSESALPLLKAALDFNPRIEQFWASYINALIKVNKLKNAKQVLKKAKKAGFVGKKFDSLRVQMTKASQEQVRGQLTPSQSPPRAEIGRMLASYQNGQYEIAQNLASSMSKLFPNDPLSYKVLGAIFGQTGKTYEALNASQRAAELSPSDAEAHSNLGNILRELGKLEEAEASCRHAITLKPDYAEAHSNLGITLQELGRLEEAEATYRQAIKIRPDYDEVHNNLGITLQELGELEGAEASYRQAIALRSDFSEAYNNLGITLQELGRLEEAEASCRQAIALRSDFPEAHNNLGITLQELGRLEEAEASYRQAIALKVDFADSWGNLGVLLYFNGNIEYAITSLEKAHKLDPTEIQHEIRLGVLQARKARQKNEVRVGNKSKPHFDVKLTSDPLILKRAVDIGLVENLYEMNSRNLDKTTDARYGNGRCSPDFQMFEEDRPIIRTVAEDLIRVMRLAVKSDVFVCDSFFNIYSTGAGIAQHRHLNKVDESKYLNLTQQKFSLVYYLSVGNQNCSEPGILKFYDPEEEILPWEGMIAIFPASRPHSAVYGGNKDRVMIGANFYSL